MNWKAHVAEYRRKHPGLTLKQSLINASKTYKKRTKVSFPKENLKQKGGNDALADHYRSREEEKRLEDKYKKYGVFSKPLMKHAERSKNPAFYVRPLAHVLNAVGLGKRK